MPVDDDVLDGQEVIAYVGLGANLGAALSTLEAAVRLCAALPESRLLARSGIYRTAPVDASGDDYFNAVVALKTRLPPDDLLQALHEIELQHGRQRPYRNAPRTLDLDILYVSDLALNDDTLILPHPRLHLRRFVLTPLNDIRPDLRLHGQADTVAELLARLNDPSAVRIFANAW